MVAATAWLLAPAAQASAGQGMQLTGTQLAAALLPASDFPAGYQRDPAWNSGSRLEHAPARYSLYTISCQKLYGDAPLAGYGETATAGDWVSSRLPASTLNGWVPSYMQSVYQFASDTAASHYFQADYSSYARWSGSVSLPHMTLDDAVPREGLLPQAPGVLRV